MGIDGQAAKMIHAIPLPWTGRVCALLHPNLGIPQDIRGNFSMKCGILSGPRSYNSFSFWPEVSSVPGFHDLLLESGRWTDL